MFAYRLLLYHRMKPLKVLLTFLLNRASLPALVLCLGLGNSMMGQIANPTNQIKELKSGLLLVIVPSYQRKLQVLRQQLESPSLKATERKRISRKIVATEITRDSFDMQLRRAFSKHFDFCSYRFIYDHQMVNPPLEKLNYDSIFYLEAGTTPNGANALIISDSQRNRLKRPFPYFVKLGHFGIVFDAFFNAHSQRWRDLNFVIIKLNKKLTRYYGL